MFHDKKTGWHLPDGEKHLTDWMVRVNDRCPVTGRLLYQGRKYRAAKIYVKRFRTAVDVGAHVGLWSMMMLLNFERVVAFEPMEEHRRCWRENMRVNGLDAKAELHECALGDRTDVCVVRTRTPGSSGDTGVEPGVAGEGVPVVPMRRLDDFDISPVDMLKVDCEGFELFVLKGGVETLKRERPMVVVEQKPETGMAARYGVGVRDAVRFLEGLGAKVRGEISGDFVMSWDA